MPQLLQQGFYLPPDVEGIWAIRISRFPWAQPFTISKNQLLQVLCIPHAHQAQTDVAVIESKCLIHDGKISAMEQNSAATQKAQLRTKLNAERAAREYNPDEASELNIHLAELCLANGVNKVTCYLPFGSEPDTELFIDWALDNNIAVLLPVSKADGTLEWVNFEGETKVGIFGFHEATGQAVQPIDVDLAIIPALAVDNQGIRIGKGKGFYDRGLLEFEPKPPIVAVVFDSEVLDSIPAEIHDHPVDAAVTPTGIKHFTQRLK